MITMHNKITQQIHNRLILRAKTISVAESCTGGQLCSLLTSLPGSSGYFILGVVTYSNKSKEMILNIPSKTIANYGAVSRQVAILMAKNIRKKAHTDIGISITGIAGPVKNSSPHRKTSNSTGLTSAITSKPVGTVFIALSNKNKTLCRLFLLPGKRESVRKESVQKALRLLYAHI
jgi:nicotinamide-nucleotide amidase